MSSSKFLPFQDANGDGLNDVCKDEIRVVEEDVCPKCTPNPNATVPNWRPRKNFQPFLNEKVCKYQITYTTPLSSTGFVDGMTEDEASQALEDIYKEYETNAIEILLQIYNKDSSDGSIELIRDVIEYVDYDLDPRPNSRLKLLYAVPFENIDTLPDAEPESDEDPSPIEVTYVAEDIGPMLVRIRKGLNLYNRYLKVYRKIENGNLYFNGRRVFNLDLYGDFGFGKTSIMRDIGDQLSNFLAANGYNINGLGSLKEDIFPSFSGADTITEITFGFTAEYRLQKIVFYTEGCGTRPIVFADKCEELRQQEAWKDQTAVSYFAKLMDMDRDLQAREPKPWIDFLIDYTYPAIYSETSLSVEESATSCVAAALADEAKQLGDDILDEVFSLGDAIAYKFHDAVCKSTLVDAREENKRLGLELVFANIPETVTSEEALLSANASAISDLGQLQREGLFGTELSDLTISELVAGDDPLSIVSEAKGNAYGMALEQAFQTLEDADQPFVNLCAFLTTQLGTGDDDSRLSQLASCIGGGSGAQGSARLQLYKLYDFGLDDLLQCGLFDFMLEAINCLFSGLTLEEALGTMIQKALEAMSINNFGDLFVGLPYDKQQELDALVKQKLESGDVFPDESSAQEFSDNIAAGVENATWQKPWENIEELPGGDSITLKDKTAAYFNIASNNDINGLAGESQPEVRTLAQSYDSAGSNLDAGVVMQAYFEALLEVYANDFLSLVDELNKFPGAPLIAEILALLDCPRPPLFNPGIMDFLKDIDLPFCRNIDPLVFPKLINPFGWLPKLKDLLRLLFEAIKCQLQLAIVKIITKLIVKLCELLGNAICNAIGVVGDIAGSLPDLVTGKDNIRNVIKDSICGEDASDEQIDQTIAEMLSALGVGGAALADQEKAVSFMEDLSSSLTYTELTQLLTGNPSESALSILDTIIEFEYPEYRDAIPNSAAAGQMFKNMGFLMPASFRSTMQDYLDQLPVDSLIPANPTICLDPERLNAFKELRCSLLEGRASPDQCKEMFCSMREQMTEDLGDIAPLTDVDNLSDYLASQLPPLVSDPGCDNGLIPYEPQSTVDAVTTALNSDLELLKVEYSTDMLGNGPGKKNWGLVNMMLSDTMGTPLSAHIRKATNQPQYVDYYDKQDIQDILEGMITSNPFAAIELMRGNLSNQRGAFPTKVAAYLQQQMNDAAGSIEVSINNAVQDDIVTTVPVSQLELSAGRDYQFARGSAIDVLEIPDLGYNVDVQTDFDADGDVVSLTFIEKARKAVPDLGLTFDDNAKGLKSLGQSDYSYGYDIFTYFSDLIKNDNGDFVNIKSDNMRIKITERVNLNAHKDARRDALAGVSIDGLDPTGSFSDDAKEEKTGFWNRGPDILTTTAYEFISVDDTLDSLTPNDQTIEEFLSDYPNFLSSFETKKEFMPQTYLFKEIVDSSNSSANIELSTVREFQNNILKSFLDKTLEMVADSEAPITASSWNFGAQYDNLTVQDIGYGVNNGGEWVPYSDTEYTNKDMILGISYDQFKNEIAGTPENTRVYYLDPTTFGGNYIKPPLYIKPLKQIGWLGLVDVLFPELSPCKPQVTDLIDFGQIQDYVNDLYPSIPEDERIKSDPDCIIELPYNRVMERSARAGMFGLVKSAIRIYVSAHFIKALPTFTKFSPKFPQVFSSAYASFIVEDMQASFLDAQGGDGDYFQTFKDSEFWYGFLEQCVQTYGYLVDAGKVDPPETVLQALIRLNDMQAAYDYPDLEDFKAAEASGETQQSLFNELGLKRYRQEKNLAAIKETEEDAKLVMKEMVIEELNYMAKIFMNNLRKLNLTPEIKDLSYYVLESFTQGTALTLNSALNIDGTFDAVYADLPTIPWEQNPDAGEDYYYTSGGELVVETNNDQVGLSVGEEYIGYYHVHIDEETGKPVYMAGEVHTDIPHDVLTPLNNITKVQIGDVSSLGDVVLSNSSEVPFVLEKYIRIGNDFYKPDEAVDIIKSNPDLKKLISDVYPGNMKLVLSEGNPVGVEGELGVRYGLKFSVAIDGEMYEITRTEIDALDTALENFTNLTGNSRLLLCLINHLVQDDKFKLVTRYILPMPKIVSIAAIYNDMGMLASIGEITVDKGDTFSFTGLNFDSAGKPGVQAKVETAEVVNADGTTVEVVSSVDVGPISEIDNYLSTETNIDEERLAPDGAWAHVDDRNRFTPFYTEWDEWDQILLRNSTSRIKKLFKSYYNSADYNDGSSLSDFLNSLRLLPGALAFQRLKNILKPATTSRLVPWWMKGRLRTNPFNANDELCENDDL
jgi:hypothetical protein